MPIQFASWHVVNSFYVDDLLGGASTIEQAKDLFRSLREVLGKGGFDLKKWRSSSPEVLRAIPTDLKEPIPTQELVDMGSATYPKALGVSWDSRADTIATHVELPNSFVSTKRGILSDIAKMFNVLGWISPVILQTKKLIQELWRLKLGWDDEVPISVRLKHEVWREELPLLQTIKMPRCYQSVEPAFNIELHGFCDASEEALAAVVYIRCTYSNHPTTSRLVLSKTRVAPLKTQSIPRLELSGAVLLTEILESTREVLGIPKQNVHAWCDSTIALAWLNRCPRDYQTYVANRISRTTSLFPPAIWRHVPTQDNPADCASRGLTAKELKAHQLWWTGPPWLLQDPILIPKQPHKRELASVQGEEAKPNPCHITIATPAEWLEPKYDSYRTMLHVYARVWLAAQNFLTVIRGGKRVFPKHLSPTDVHAAETRLLKASQARVFPSELSRLKSNPPKPILSTSKLLCLHPFLGQDGLLHVGGRLSQANIPMQQKHPIIVSAKDILLKSMFTHEHVRLQHCGPTLLLSHVARLYHVVGGRMLARTTCKACVTCKKAAAQVQSQLMGQLPAARINPSSVFENTGIDYAGPFIIKKGHTRRPVLIKAYLSIFVCFSTRAVHLEVVSDLTTATFLAALDRFIARRGRPKAIHTDNGLNFVGAKNQLQELYAFMSSTELQSAVHSHLLTEKVDWHTIPERAPHFGGLWEAAVKSCKYHLKRIIGQTRLTFEELSTIAAQVEACLNSRPLGPVTSHSIDGEEPLTAGHFLIGKPLKAYPEVEVSEDDSLLDRWTKCRAMIQHFWRRWSSEYLQILQRSNKWHNTKPNLQVGDVVVITDDSHFKTSWVMGKVIATYPGKDDLVRAVDVQTETLVQSPPSTLKKATDPKQMKTKTHVFRRPITKVALLVPAEAPPDQTTDQQSEYL